MIYNDVISYHINVTSSIYIITPTCSVSAKLYYVYAMLWPLLQRH